MKSVPDLRHSLKELFSWGRVVIAGYDGFEDSWSNLFGSTESVLLQSLANASSYWATPTELTTKNISPRDIKFPYLKKKKIWNNFIYYYIGWAGSLLLLGFFSVVENRSCPLVAGHRLLSHCGKLLSQSMGSGHSGFSSCGTWAQ